MKKYFTFIPDDEKFVEVNDALSAVGFERFPACLLERTPPPLFIGLNRSYAGETGYYDGNDGFDFYTQEGYLPITTDYIINHAADLDGAKPKEPTVTIDGKDHPVKKVQALIDAALEFKED